MQSVITVAGNLWDTIEFDRKKLKLGVVNFQLVWKLFQNYMPAGNCKIHRDDVSLSQRFIHETWSIIETVIYSLSFFLSFNVKNTAIYSERDFQQNNWIIMYKIDGKNDLFCIYAY